MCLVPCRDDFKLDFEIKNVWISVRLSFNLLFGGFYLVSVLGCVSSVHRGYFIYLFLYLFIFSFFFLLGFDAAFFPFTLF